MILKPIKVLINYISKLSKNFFSSMYISSKFLFIIATFSLFLISCSVFIPNLDATDNLVTIRTVFSSITGWILESSSRKIICNDRDLLVRNYIVGSFATIILFVLALSIYFSADVNNPSLLLLKNTLFSSVGFLISSSQSCE